MRYFTTFLHGFFVENNTQIFQKYQGNAFKFISSQPELFRLVLR